MKRFLLIVFCIILLFNNSIYTRAYTLKVSKSYVKIVKGNTVSIKYYAKGKATAKCSNNRIVSVTAKKKFVRIKAKKCGSTYVSLKYRNKTVKLRVTVVKKSVPKKNDVKVIITNPIINVNNVVTSPGNPPMNCLPTDTIVSRPETEDSRPATEPNQTAKPTATPRATSAPISGNPIPTPCTTTKPGTAPSPEPDNSRVNGWEDDNSGNNNEDIKEDKNETLN